MNGQRDGALVDQAPIELGEAHVVADTQAQLAERRVADHDLFAGHDLVGLLERGAVGEVHVEQVDLAVHALDLARVREVDRRVVDLTVWRGLPEPAEQELDPVRARPLATAREDGTALGQRLRDRTLTTIRPEVGKTLRKHHELCTLHRCFCDEPRSRVEVVRDIGRRGHLHHCHLSDRHAALLPRVLA